MIRGFLHLRLHCYSCLGEEWLLAMSALEQKPSFRTPPERCCMPGTAPCVESSFKYTTNWALTEKPGVHALAAQTSHALKHVMVTQHIPAEIPRRLKNGLAPLRASCTLTSTHTTLPWYHSKFPPALQGSGTATLTVAGGGYRDPVILPLLKNFTSKKF